ncbi:hypothetical protein [Yersinia rochesterensis]|uniref:hypothetical protein n=1 Tax=Yersinia rochesterensis TaxID=1604335 RepID=UPI0011A0A5CD|nr:hypothetical protein [Yersinia rochesterensis]
MTELPEYGERYRHKEGWTVRIVNLKLASEQTQRQNPEFRYEVIFNYDLTTQYSSMPLTWFAKVYSKIADAPEHDPITTLNISKGLLLHKSVKYIYPKKPYSERRPTEKSEEHYSHFL